MGVRFHKDDFEYSEHGLQGENYVHLDVSPEAALRFLTDKPHRPSPSKSATTFSLGTRRKGNDGRTWVVRATLTGVRRWVPE